MKSKICKTAKLPALLLFIAVFLILHAKAQVNLQEGLVAYYPFNGNANDESGNGNHGTPSGQVYFDNGIIGTSARIIGGGYIGVGGGNIVIPFIDFNTLTSFTICLWVNEISMSHFHGESYVFFGDHYNQYITIAHFSDYLQYAVGSSVISIPFDYTTLNQWVFYVLKFNNGIMTGYKNNEQVGQTHGVTYNIFHQRAAIARHWWSNGSMTSTRFNGWIDEVRIYNRTLNEQELYTLYNEGQPPQTNNISNILINQRNDGSGMVDVYFNLYATGSQYNITLEASFDGGNTYTAIPASFLSGDVSNISPGTNKHIVWDGLSSHPNTYSTATKLKIIAN